MNSFIICGDARQYPIKIPSIDIKRKISADIAEFADYDGDFVNKRGNRGLEFNLDFIFDGDNYLENTKAFLESAKDTRPVKVFLPYEENAVISQIISISWKEDFIKDVECVKFSLTLHETIGESNFESSGSEFAEMTNAEFADRIINPHIQKCMAKIKNKKFVASFAAVNNTINKAINGFSKLSKRI